MAHKITVQNCLLLSFSESNPSECVCLLMASIFVYMVTRLPLGVCGFGLPHTFDWLSESYKRSKNGFHVNTFVPLTVHTNMEGHTTCTLYLSGSVFCSISFIQKNTVFKRSYHDSFAAVVKAHHGTPKPALACTSQRCKGT